MRRAAHSDGDDATSVDDFLAEIRAYFHNDARIQGETVSIEATGRSSDGAAIIIYRQSPSAALSGLHIDLHEFAKLFGKRDARFLAYVVSSDEIADPGGLGDRLEVDWADGLVDHPSAIGWRRF